LTFAGTSETLAGCKVVPQCNLGCLVPWLLDFVICRLQIWRVVLNLRVIYFASISYRFSCFGHHLQKWFSLDY
jgi:hypothetical protein